MTIKTRLLIIIFLFVLLAFAASGVLTVNRTRAGMIKRIDQSLASSPIRPLLQPGNNAHGPGRQAFATVLLRADGSVRYSSPSGYPDEPDPLPNLAGLSLEELDRNAGTFFNVGADDGADMRYRVLLQNVREGGYLALAAPLTDVEATTRGLIIGMTLSSLAILTILLIVVWLVIRHGLRPIDDMIASAGQIAAGDLSHRIEHADDTTEVGQLGGALNQMLGQIETSFAAKQASEQRLRRFVADASHELRTPLTSILGYTELYRSGAAASPEGVARAMSRIESEGSRMGKLVDDLLLLARLDQGRELQREPVELGRLAADAVTAARAIEPNRPISLERNGSVWVSGDADRLRQVIDNLLSNVRQHTAAGDAVRVTIGGSDEKAVLTVADDGPGMTEEAAARVFDRFFRADPSRSRASGGSGLGLSIVSSIVTAHQGSVDLDTAPGKGATFRVVLNRIDAPPSA